MGSLVNAKAMRLGWFSNWSDSWFVERSYYAYYLYIILRLRFFLTYIWNFESIESTGTFYSHFHLASYNSCFFISIYIYDGHIESLIQDFHFDVRVAHARLNRLKRPKDKLPKWLWTVWRTFMFLGYFGLFNPYMWTKSALRALTYYFKVENLKKILQMHQSIDFKLLVGLKADELAENVYLMLVFFRMIQNSAKHGTFKVKYTKRQMYTRLLYLTLFKRWRLAFIRPLKKFIYYMFSTFSFTKDKKIKILYITGDCVTADFLSRYIARKLHQNYTIFELFRSIRRELFYVAYSSRYPSLKTLRFKELAGYVERHENKYFRESVYKKLLASTFKIYSKFNYRYYCNRGTFLTCDTISAYKTAYSYACKNFIDASKLISIGVQFTKIRWLYFQFFTLNRQTLKQNLNNVFLPNSGVLYNKFSNFSQNMECVNQYFTVTYYNMLFTINWETRDTFPLRFIIANMKRFVKYHRWNYNINWIYSALKVNKRNERLRPKTNLTLLTGFRIVCVGRLTRRNRSTRRIADSRYMPLNTLSAVIDYGFYTIPLKNSTVCIKVWLYKKKGFSSFFYRTN